MRPERFNAIAQFNENKEEWKRPNQRECDEAMCCENSRFALVGVILERRQKRCEYYFSKLSTEDRDKRAPS